MPKHIKLITTVDIPSQEDKISSASKILTLGSCFSDHIGQRLSNHFFDTLVNPFGTIFNPMSIARVLDMALANELIAKDDIGHDQNRCFHFDFHSSFDSSNPDDVVQNINNAIIKVGDFIRKTDVLIITFGTSIVYKLKSDDRIVSNCHKVPNVNFQKELLSVEIMAEAMKLMINKIRNLNNSINIILTVSPVRHTKEGLIKNSFSKSRLIDLCHRLIEKDDSISYFPAFEIMVDELRDYRYYSSDLIHPSDLAVDIIWSRFMETYFNSESFQKVKDFSELNSAKNHRPFNPNSEVHKNFKQSQLEKIEKLNGVYPEVDFQELKDFFNT